MKTYIFSILAVAIVCGFFNKCVSNKANASVIRLATGIVMALVILQPFREYNFMDLDELVFDVKDQALAVQMTANAERKTALSELIKKETEAYILKQAQVFNANISVEIIISDDAMPVPEYVRISGQIAPYAKKQLINIIERELGVAEENQLWI